MSHIPNEKKSPIHQEYTCMHHPFTCQAILHVATIPESCLFSSKTYILTFSNKSTSDSTSIHTDAAILSHHHVDPNSSNILLQMKYKCACMISHVATILDLYQAPRCNKFKQGIFSIHKRIFIFLF